MQFTELTDAQIAELQSTAKTSYASDAIKSFRDAGIHGADVSDAFPGRKLSNVSQALKRIAARSEYQGIKVVLAKRDDNTEVLALINENVA